MTICRCRQTISRAMPVEVQALASTWPSLVGVVPGLTTELEKDFRFGQSVIHLVDRYRIGGAFKAGTSTMWYPSNEAEFQAYEGWRARESFAPRHDPVAFAELLSLLTGHGIVLSAGRSGVVGEAVGEVLALKGSLFESLRAVLAALPPSHLARAQLQGIQIGGWGPDAAKGSAYDDGRVLLYDFALDGARRTFLGLLLHELGHVQEAGWDPEARHRLEEAHRTLVDGLAFLGVEFLLDGETRQLMQRFAFGEFLAETYMIYASQGGRLRMFIESLEGRVRSAWEVVYDLHRRAFEGVEYA